ncbi:serine/threonine-protein kinase [Micromonospora sp. NPDC000089]|uniref:serine/threonine-protein kinase n=1 Tax=unclassified Micromonospora TaxID=2617518 RepID=UPI00367D91E8
MEQLLVAGRYRLLDLVGTGGMGRVWLARDEMLHRDVAVKEVVPPNWLAESEREELRLRTLREARTAARLNHPNVVRIYDVVHFQDSPWIVMEYVPSRSVQQILTTDGPLAPSRVAEIGLSVLAALRAAHAAGVLHRDVKPHNVLVATDGRVVLTDFGLATFDGGDGLMTGPGMVLGSPQFVAPERAREGVSNPRTDMWSLGATLYAAVEGQSPYARGSSMATLSALATEPPDPVRRAGPLGPVLTGLLRRDPAQRLDGAQTESLLRAALAAGDAVPVAGRPPEHLAPRPGGITRPALGGPADPDTGPTPPALPAAPVRRSTGRRRAVLVAAGVTVALLAAGGAVLSQRGEERALPPSPGVGGGTSSPGAGSGTPSPRPGAFACSAAAPPQAVPVPTAPPPPDERYGLIDGWTWYTDPTGFRIAAPTRWLRYTDGAATCFREPGGSRVLSVTPGAAPADPVRYWKSEERRLTGNGKLTGYQQVAITPLDMFAGGALWECAWTTAAGTRVQTARLIMTVAPGRAYTVSWLTNQFDWQVNREYFLMIRQSFRPPTP